MYNCNSYILCQIKGFELFTQKIIRVLFDKTDIERRDVLTDNSNTMVDGCSADYIKIGAYVDISAVFSGTNIYAKE